MRHHSTQLPTGPSRRRFLCYALAVTPLAARPTFTRTRDPEREKLARLLAKYGSEIGDLRRIEGRE